MTLRSIPIVLLSLFSLPATAQQDGNQLFGVHCARCHAPVEIERRIRNDWAGRPASALFERTRQTMPAGAPGSLSDDEYLRLLRYLFDVGKVQYPARTLTADRLDHLLLVRGAADEGETVPWRNIHGELDANRYSPLDQIDAGNAHELEVAWRWKAGNFGPTPEIRSVTMPIMHDGRLFLGAGTTRNVVSVDAATGQTLWMWRPDEGERFENAARKSSGMGVAYWQGGDGRRRVITVTPGYFLVSLNAATGLPDPEFGRGGWVDLTEGLRKAADRDLDIGLNAPPLVVGDVIVVGAAHAQRQGRRARLRCENRQAALDLPHHPRAGRAGL